MSDLCESAKKGHWCPDDLCHGQDVTLCGFDKDWYDREVAVDDDDEDQEASGLWECYEPEDEDDDG